MTKHYVLSFDPTAKYEWDRCTLRDPITAERPELAELVAEAVGKQSGSYLVSVNIEIKVLERAPSQTKPSVIGNVESAPVHKELAA
ncbi:hypothetical protein IQ268_00795 [Oculatella sp. LEGE 06141]|uniref:hypothetical protein n=1 Tax=Oculatella sp. LEGE 06141 TaxID=1828648 RepID=UPI0018801A7D|nr:hypothetical protein [Oculatella sp. LEGE 06141]MBE9177112.1 hypothetical protein [Oculatella sp. LEGE 06141]